MRKLADYKVMHFKIDCDKYIADRRAFPDALSFVTEAVGYEDAGYELSLKKHWNEEETISHLLPLVSDNAYIAHRCTYHPTEEINDWWEFVDRPGRGHVKVWHLDMDEAKAVLANL